MPNHNLFAVREAVTGTADLQPQFTEMESAMDDAKDMYESQPSLRLRNTEARLARLIQAVERTVEYMHACGWHSIDLDDLLAAVEEAKKP
jgi:hypothetical protein